MLGFTFHFSPLQDFALLLTEMLHYFHSEFTEAAEVSENATTMFKVTRYLFHSIPSSKHLSFFLIYVL